MPLGLNDNELELSESEVSDITFASAEARFALLRARRLRLVLHIAAMSALLLASTAFSLVIRGRRGHGQGPLDSFFGDNGGGPEGPPKLDIEPVGSEDAKVKIIAVLPDGSDCHSGVAKLLVDIATARPEEIRVDFVSVDSFSVAEPELQAKIGQPCAAIVVNREVDFQFLRKGKLRAVNLVGNEPTNYKMSDVGDAITLVYKKEYGDPGEPIYTLEKKKGCDSGEAACGDEHPDELEDEEPEELEVKVPITVTLPGKLPAIKGLK